MTTEPGTSTTVAPIDPERTAELTAAWFNSAGDDRRLGDRLATAETVAHIHLGGRAGVTVDLSKAPICAEPQITGRAEVELWVTPEQLVAMIRRERQLAMLIANGTVGYAGPVRKLLRVVPIMRSLDFGMWRKVLPRPEQSR